MNDTSKQNKSPFILLAILSILVVATLVVASLYFMHPMMTTQPVQSVTTESQVEKTVPLQEKIPDVISQNSESKPVETQATDLAKTESNKSTIKAIDKQDNCNVLFTSNQLLVKNTHQQSSDQ